MQSAIKTLSEARRHLEVLENKLKYLERIQASITGFDEDLASLLENVSEQLIALEVSFQRLNDAYNSQKQFGFAGTKKAEYLDALELTIRNNRASKRLAESVERFVLHPALGLDKRLEPIGPDIDWRGPTEEVELQFFRKSEPFYDVGFLKRGIDQAASVCRVENIQGVKLGTGFLIAPNLILTNYHVLVDPYTDEDIKGKITDIVVRFGCVSADDGREEEGQTFPLSPTKPLMAYSLTHQLDYALLQVDNTIKQVIEMSPIPYELQRTPVKGTGLHILQHAEGEALRVALSNNGVTGVYDDGRIQYLTKTAGGSSGSPCFNDDWKIIAIHHAERSRAFGTIREGILFSVIYEEIKQHLG